MKAKRTKMAAKRELLHPSVGAIENSQGKICIGIWGYVDIARERQYTPGTMRLTKKEATHLALRLLLECTQVDA
jgi:hypothetical protein